MEAVFSLEGGAPIINSGSIIRPQSDRTSKRTLGSFIPRRGVFADSIDISVRRQGGGQDQRRGRVHCESGAYDTRTLDPVYSLNASRASGVLVAVDEGIFKALLEKVPCERALKERRGVTPRTVVELLVSFGMPKEPDLLKIDIDSFDIFVVEAADTADEPDVLRPWCSSWNKREDSATDPIHIHQYSGPFAWNGNHCFGVSLTKAAHGEAPG